MYYHTKNILNKLNLCKKWNRIFSCPYILLIILYFIYVLNFGFLIFLRYVWWSSALIWRSSSLIWRSSSLIWRSSALIRWSSALIWRSSALIWWSSALILIILILFCYYFYRLLVYTLILSIRLIFVTNVLLGWSFALLTIWTFSLLFKYYFSRLIYT